LNKVKEVVLAYDNYSHIDNSLIKKDQIEVGQYIRIKNRLKHRKNINKHKSNIKKLW